MIIGLEKAVRFRIKGTDERFDKTTLRGNTLQNSSKTDYK